jgi:hypothetical protein
MIRARLTDSYEWIRAEAAHALWRCTSDTADTVPVLVRLLDGYPYLPMFAPVHSVVVECLGNIGAPAEPAAPILIRYLEADQRRDPPSRRPKIRRTDLPPRACLQGPPQLRGGLGPGFSPGLGPGITYIVLYAPL